jgi:hypothetical protein
MPVPQNTVIVFQVISSPIRVIGIPALLSEDAAFKL